MWRLQDLMLLPLPSTMNRDTCWAHKASVICCDSRLGWLFRQIFFLNNQTGCLLRFDQDWNLEDVQLALVQTRQTKTMSTVTGRILDPARNASSPSA